MEEQITNDAKNEPSLNQIDTLKWNRLKDRFAKWHTKQIDLLTFYTNLTFTISMAFFGFISNKYFDTNLQNNVVNVSFSLEKSILFCLAFSITIGVLGFIIRLNDFKYTTRTIKSRRKIFEINKNIIKDVNSKFNIEIETNKINKFICCTTILGKITWWIFYIQIGLLLTTLWLIFLSI